MSRQSKLRQHLCLESLSSFIDFFERSDISYHAPNAFMEPSWLAAAWRLQEYRGHTVKCLVSLSHAGDVLGIFPFYLAHQSNELVVRALTVGDNQSFEFIPQTNNTISLYWRDTLRDLGCRRIEVHCMSTPSISNSPVFQHSYFTECQTATNWGIDCDTTWETYFNTRSRKLKKGLNLSRNRLTKQGNWTIERYITNHLPTLERKRLIDICTHLSSLSWKGADEQALHGHDVQLWAQTLAEHANGMECELWLWIGCIDKTPICYELQWVSKTTKQVHGLRSDYDERYKDGGPGSLMQLHIIQNLIADQDVERYWLGLGDNSYKQRWTNINTPRYHLVFSEKNLKNALKYGWRTRIKPTISAIKQKLMRLVHAGNKTL